MVDSTNQRTYTAMNVEGKSSQAAQELLEHALQKVKENDALSTEEGFYQEIVSRLGRLERATNKSAEEVIEAVIENLDSSYFVVEHTGSKKIVLEGMVRSILDDLGFLDNPTLSGDPKTYESATQSTAELVFLLNEYQQQQKEK